MVGLLVMCGLIKAELEGFEDGESSFFVVGRSVVGVVGYMCCRGDEL